MIKSGETLRHSLRFSLAGTHLTRDYSLNDQLTEAAEGQVLEWASAQTLPFPQFPEDYRKQVTDTLDYPPEASPGADRGLTGSGGSTTGAGRLLRVGNSISPTRRGRRVGGRSHQT
jgi:hypothetical protein